jgi:hypothetical protein
MLQGTVTRADPIYLYIYIYISGHRDPGLSPARDPVLGPRCHGHPPDSLLATTGLEGVVEADPGLLFKIGGRPPKFRLIPIPWLTCNLPSSTDETGLREDAERRSLSASHILYT